MSSLERRKIKNEICTESIESHCAEVSAILKALSHPLRLVILSHLLNGRKTVSELLSLCEGSQSQMSQFLIRMKYEGLLKSEKEGKYQYYSVADERLIRVIKILQKEYCV